MNNYKISESEDELIRWIFNFLESSIESAEQKERIEEAFKEVYNLPLEMTSEDIKKYLELEYRYEQAEKIQAESEIKFLGDKKHKILRKYIEGEKI
jgi:hypothetical protein